MTLLLRVEEPSACLVEIEPSLMRDTPDGLTFVRLADLSLDCPAAKTEKWIAANLDAQFARTRLEGGEIRECPTPLPPLAEQHRIVARVEELRRLCAQLRERLTDARRTQSHLADALVAEVAA
jgi:hypothetical protein